MKCFIAKIKIFFVILNFGAFETNYRGKASKYLLTANAIDINIPLNHLLQI